MCIGFVQTRFRFVGGGLGARSMSNKPFQKREGVNAIGGVLGGSRCFYLSVLFKTTFGFCVLVSGPDR